MIEFSKGLSGLDENYPGYFRPLSSIRGCPEYFSGPMIRSARCSAFSFPINSVEELIRLVDCASEHEKDEYRRRFLGFVNALRERYRLFFRVNWCRQNLDKRVFLADRAMGLGNIRRLVEKNCLDIFFPDEMAVIRGHDDFGCILACPQSSVVFDVFSELAAAHGLYLHGKASAGV